jgi:hypothetical protein
LDSFSDHQQSNRLPAVGIQTFLFPTSDRTALAAISGQMSGILSLPVSFNRRLEAERIHWLVFACGSSGTSSALSSG